jgi:hypothetical protein
MKEAANWGGLSTFRLRCSPNHQLKFVMASIASKDAHFRFSARLNLE